MVQELLGLPEKISRMEVSAITTPDNELARRAAQDPQSLNPTDYETWYCTAYVSAICHQIQEVVRDGVAKPVRQARCLPQRPFGYFLEKWLSPA